MSDATRGAGDRLVIGGDDIDALYEGAKFYSPAVGDANRSALLTWLRAELTAHGPVPLVSVDALDPATGCAALCVIGSGFAMADLPPAGDEFRLAVERLEHITGVHVGAVYPLAAATVSALIPIAVAAQLGVPLVDGDGMGRAFALVGHTSMSLAGLPITPLVAFGPTGESVVIEAGHARRADHLLRANVDIVGGWAALAAYPVTIGALRPAILRGTVSRLLRVGRLLLEPSDSEAQIAALGPLTDCRRIARGRIVELEHLSRPNDVTVPAHPTSLVLEEVGRRARQIRIELRSEIVAAFVDGALVAATPDVICLFDVLSGQLATLDALEPGHVVDIVEAPADPVWHAPAGLELVGPGSHGIPLPHPRSVVV